MGKELGRRGRGAMASAAQLFGCSPAHLRNCIVGRKRPGAELRQKIQAALGVRAELWDQEVRR